MLEKIVKAVFKLIYNCIYPEDYVINVQVAESKYVRRTYLPCIHGKYPSDPSGTRPINDRDIAGRWSLGWRPNH